MNFLQSVICPAIESTESNNYVKILEFYLLVNTSVQVYHLAKDAFIMYSFNGFFKSISHELAYNMFTRFNNRSENNSKDVNININVNKNDSDSDSDSSSESSDPEEETLPMPFMKTEDIPSIDETFECVKV